MKRNVNCPGNFKLVLAIFLSEMLIFSGYAINVFAPKDVIFSANFVIFVCVFQLVNHTL